MKPILAIYLMLLLVAGGCSGSKEDDSNSTDSTSTATTKVEPTKVEPTIVGTWAVNATKQFDAIVEMALKKGREDAAKDPEKKTSEAMIKANSEGLAKMMAPAWKDAKMTINEDKTCWIDLKAFKAKLGGESDSGSGTVRGKGGRKEGHYTMDGNTATLTFKDEKDRGNIVITLTLNEDEMTGLIAGPSSPSVNMPPIPMVWQRRDDI